MPTSGLIAKPAGGNSDATGRSEAARVSIVIPAFNAAKTVRETIESVLGQTVPAAEIIVVDDGSTDATVEILETYGPRIKIVRQPHAGLATARNTGCAAATGEFIAFIDADDVAVPDRLAVQIACMRSDPAIVLCHSDFSVFGENVEKKSSYFRTYYSTARAAPHLEDLLGPERKLEFAERIPIHVGNVYERIAHGNFVHPPTMMFQRELFEKAGPFDRQIHNMCDWDWIVRASREGLFAFINKPLLAYRLSPDQLSGPKYSAQAALDVVEVAKRILRRDTQLYERQRPKFRAELGYYYMIAADVLADSSTASSLTMLAISLSYGVLDRKTLPILIKALLPAGVLTGLRHARRIFASRMAEERA